MESLNSCKHNLAEDTNSGPQVSPKLTIPENAQVSTKFLTHADTANAVASNSDDYLRKELYLLKTKFEDLLYEFELSLQERRIDVIQITKYFKLIPITDNLQLKHCVPDFSMIFRANSISELLFVLAPCWDYLHLGLLRHLIHKFGSDKNKQNLQNYFTNLEKFRCKVFVGNFIRVCNKKPENISEFYCVHLMAVMDKKWETATLQDVEELRLELTMKPCCSELIKAYPVLSSIAISFSIPFWINLNLKRTIPLLCSKGAVKVFLNERCIVDSNEKVSITCSQYNVIGAQCIVYRLIS